MTESELKFKEIEEIYSEVVEKLGATTKLYNDYKNSLSGGQTQRNSVFYGSTGNYSSIQFINPQVIIVLYSLLVRR